MKPRSSSVVLLFFLVLGVGWSTFVEQESCVQEQVAPESSPRIAKLIESLTSDLIEEREKALNELSRIGEPAVSMIRAAVAAAEDKQSADQLRFSLEAVVRRFVGSRGTVAFNSGGSIRIARLDGYQVATIPAPELAEEGAFYPLSFAAEGTLMIHSRHGLHAATAPDWNLKSVGSAWKESERVIFDQSARYWTHGTDVLLQDRSDELYRLCIQTDGHAKELHHTKVDSRGGSVMVRDYQVAREKSGRLLVVPAYCCYDAPVILAIEPATGHRVELHRGDAHEGVVFQWNATQDAMAVVVGKRLWIWDGVALKCIFEGMEHLRHVRWSSSGRRLAVVDWRERFHVLDMTGTEIWTYNEIFTPSGNFDVDVAWIDEENVGILVKRTAYVLGTDRILEEKRLLVANPLRRSVSTIAEGSDLVFGTLQVVNRDSGLIYFKITERGEWAPGCKSGEFTVRHLGVDLFYYNLKDSRSCQLTRLGLLGGGEIDTSKTLFEDPRFYLR